MSCESRAVVIADFTQAAVADAIAHTENTNPWSSLGSSITPTTGALWAYITLHHAFVEVTTNTNPPSFYVQTNLGTTDESWTTVAQFTATDADPVIENLTATEPIGETVMTVGSTTGFLYSDYIYIDDVGTPANSEWHQIQQINSVATDITLTAGLVTAKDTNDNIYSEAETFTMTLDLSGVARWRVIYLNEGTAPDTAIWVRYIEVTDIE